MNAKDTGTQATGTNHDGPNTGLPGQDGETGSGQDQDDDKGIFDRIKEALG